VAQLEENLRAGGATNIPKFASGGMHAGGLRIVGERGWEVEATGPARIWNQQQLSQALGGDTARLEALVEELIAKVAALEAPASATAESAAQTSSVLRSVALGNALIVKNAPTTV